MSSDISFSTNLASELASRIEAGELTKKEAYELVDSFMSAAGFVKTSENEYVEVDLEEEDLTDDDGVDLSEFKSFIKENDELDEVVSGYGYEEIFNAMDEDGDGILTNSEIESLGFDADELSDLTVDNIKEIAQNAGIEEEVKLDSELLNKLKELLAKSNNANNASGTTTSTGSTPSVSNTGGTTSSGSSSTNTTAAAVSDEPDEMTMDELLVQRETYQADVNSAYEALNAIQSGEDKEVKSAVDNADEKEEIYEEALENDEKINAELKEEQKENKENIEETENGITETKNAITEAEETIYECENQISLLTSQISALNASLSALPDETEENKEEVKAMRESINSQIEEAESQKEEYEAKKEEAEENKEEYEKQLEELEEVLEELEEERSRIEEEILDTCSDETKAALIEYQEARENIETVKNERTEIVTAELETAQTSLEEVDASIIELQEMQIQLENRVSEEGEDVVAFAEALDGLSASEMKQIMQAAGCRFDDGAWCADFVTYVTKQVYGNEETPGDYANNCSNTASCDSIASWAKSNGILTTDSSLVQPGDYILYGNSSDYTHVGIVTSVNADGTVNTIEGNTSDDSGSYTNGVVNAHSNRTGTYVLLSQL